MSKKQHSNLHINPNVHHLYLIYDFQEREIYKFGISDKPVSVVNVSSRLTNQVMLFNRIVGSKRFAGRIINFPINGRLEARRLEDNMILKFKEKFSQLPRGNENHQFLKNRNYSKK